jgi:hypothetical protein
MQNPAKPPPDESETAVPNVRHTPTLFDIAPFVAERTGRRADALLPAAVVCNDPISGKWVSREYYPEYGDWYRFELHIRRDRKSASGIVGEIVSRSWTGEADDAKPQPCRSGATGDDEFDRTVQMAASGSAQGDRVSFEGQSIRSRDDRCGVPLTNDSYNLDRFSGHLLEDGRHLVAFNNDGGRCDNDLHLFRRVACK